MSPLVTDHRIFYRGGYRYQLEIDYEIVLPLRGHSAQDDFILLEPGGRFVVSKGYAWDGPSGPALDTRTFMRASLIHDALYQLIRRRKVPDAVKDAADEILRETCLEDGMWKWKAWAVWWAVAHFAAPSTRVARTVESAP